LPSWQTAVRDAVRDPAELAAVLELGAGAPPAAATDFPMLVPRGFAARMRKGDPADPLLRQVWPHADERFEVAGFGPDPVAEQASASAGVLQKYPGRALLIASGACPIHCRYCFRRSFPYSAQMAARADWSAALATLHGRTDLHEVILSGGDPLSLSNRKLADLIAKLESTTASTLRFHTRFPIVVPERVDSGLLDVLARTRLEVVVVLHCNHAAELAPDVGVALRALKPHVAALLNQAVLLRGVNDAAEALEALSRHLFEHGVLPYYLHVLDRVAGAAHFEVDEATGKALVDEIRARLPGYLVPRLVREVPGELSKAPIV
jgi:EF-P beta-lysylation protein EpmB